MKKGDGMGGGIINQTKGKSENDGTTQKIKEKSGIATSSIIGVNKAMEINDTLCFWNSTHNLPRISFQLLNSFFPSNKVTLEFWALEIGFLDL